MFKFLQIQVCWLISNITCGTQEQVQAVIDSGIIPIMINQVFTKQKKKRIRSSSNKDTTTKAIDSETKQIENGIEENQTPIAENEEIEENDEELDENEEEADEGDQIEDQEDNENENEDEEVILPPTREQYANKNNNRYNMDPLNDPGFLIANNYNKKPKIGVSSSNFKQMYSYSDNRRSPFAQNNRISSPKYAQNSYFHDYGMNFNASRSAQTTNLNVQNEATWVLSNATMGSDEQVMYLAENGCTTVFCDVLLNPATDPKVMNVTLEGLKNILDCGAKDRRNNLKNMLLKEEISKKPNPNEAVSQFLENLNDSAKDNELCLKYGIENPFLKQISPKYVQRIAVLAHTNDTAKAILKIYFNPVFQEMFKKKKESENQNPNN